MLSDFLLAALRCPNCRQPLHRRDTALACPAGHAFDLARQGYVHLGGGRRLPAGDDAAMVAARERFLGAGHFAPLRQALAQQVTDALAPADAGPPAGAGADEPPRHRLLVDLGGGTGYYLAGALDALPGAEGLVLDVAKPALRRAARAHPRMGAVLADTWGALPLADASADLLLNVFAPRNGEQMRRVLRPDGRLVVVTPLGDHLTEVRAPLGLLDVDRDKADRLARSLPSFAIRDERTLRGTLTLSHRDLADLVGMGPSARHLTPERLAAGVAALPEPYRVSLAVRITTLG